MLKSALVDDLVCYYRLSLLAKNLHRIAWFFPTGRHSILPLLRLCIYKSISYHRYLSYGWFHTKVIPTTCYYYFSKLSLVSNLLVYIIAYMQGMTSIHISCNLERFFVYSCARLLAFNQRACNDKIKVFVEV